ncbi:hypothetical protein Kisp01_42450 [Kineosporia sp. NBRC 101677]|uniref:hypothetical protein n=1 Tax=Kineosporia sp. NBRC 101677 TaxID=3032197 RepID=UPI0024A1ECD8|nr:hypothetical protein [Kineosporia sp. NBRC 101677]GLY17230.1 hypothetical protein Kisp01_42450 [Kineosporia sp. NBRC 101677]
MGRGRLVRELAPGARVGERNARVRTLEDARSGAGAAVDAELQRIEQATREARQAHLRLLDTLLQAILGDRADLVFSDGDLSC